MSAVASTAVERGWARIDLFVEKGRPATSFYETIGMTDQGHLHYQISGEEMRNLADSVRR